MPTYEKIVKSLDRGFTDSFPEPAVAPGRVIAELEKHILVDGFKIVIDLERSRGSLLVDAANGRQLVDLYSFYASMPVR